MMTLYGRHMEVMFGFGKVFELHADNAGVIAQFHTDDYDFAVVQFKPMAYP